MIKEMDIRCHFYGENSPQYGVGSGWVNTFVSVTFQLAKRIFPANESMKSKTLEWSIKAKKIDKYKCMEVLIHIFKNSFWYLTITSILILWNVT